MPASDGLRRREVRRTVRAIAVTAALSALALLSGAAPLGGQAPSSTTKAPAAVLAITGGGWIPQRLVRLDALTLRRLPGKAVRLGAETAGSAFSPDRSRVAIGGPAWQGVRIVDVRRMRLLGTVRPTARRGGGELIPLAWLGK